MTNGIIILDGIRCRLKQKDLDGDGKTGGIENIGSHFSQDTATLDNSKIEGQELIKELNKDINDTDIGLNTSTVDFLSRLHFTQVPATITWDFLTNVGFLPKSAIYLTRLTKRTYVSLEGKGRQEAIEMIGGRNKIEGIKKGGFMQNLLGGKSGEKTENEQKQ